MARASLRPWGKIRYDRESRTWIIDAEPHMILRLKRIFKRINLAEHGTVSLSHTHEVAVDILWVMKRYTFEISKTDLWALRRASRFYTEQLKRLEDLVDPNYKAPALALAVPAREYQKVGALAYLTRKRLLLADDVGLGKTATAICSFTDPRTLPAVVVTLAGTLPNQWQAEIKKFAPGLRTHVIRRGKPYSLPNDVAGKPPDVVILNYHKLEKWAEILAKYGKSIVFDEVQELRRRESLKYSAAAHIANGMDFKIGLSATPIYNYGSEIWNVVNAIDPGVLGLRDEFIREWCIDSGSQNKQHALRDPKAFGTYLREQFIMLRRTRHEVGRELPSLIRIPQTVETNTADLDQVEDAASELARIILGDTERVKGEKMRAAEELSNVLRQATGIAKAPYVAEFIRLLVDSGERPLVYAWHREVYSILMHRLEDLNPVMFTGTESVAQKEEAKDKFTKGEANILLMSLRAGAGVDGLQKCCRTVVFAELDWSPGVHEQAIGRVHRDGQPDPVTAYFLVAEKGADPVISETLGLKREQVEGIRNPKAGVLEGLQADPGHIKRLAQEYLRRHKGKTPPAPVKQ